MVFARKAAQRPQTRGEQPVKRDIKLGDKTPVAFNNVGPDGAKITEGLQAGVWLEAGAKDQATKVSFTGVVWERWTVVTGRVAASSKDGQTITVEQAQPARGEQRPPVSVKLTAETRIAFWGVGPDEAKLTEGYDARARLIAGSKDAAAQVMFAPPGVGRRRSGPQLRAPAARNAGSITLGRTFFEMAAP